MINQISQEINSTARQKGFWPEVEDNKYLLGTKLALIHSEVSEALEAFRAERYDEIESELADIIIRVLDLAWEMGFQDMENVILNKMEKNSNRPFRHGKSF